MGMLEIVQAITVTAELTNANLSGAAMSVMAEDLASAYPEDAILRALSRCRRELSRPLTAGAVFERLSENDGRPGVEEAWAMCPQSENDSVCWTLEMREAYSIARQLSDHGDRIGARMAFKDTYERLCRESRENGFPAKWELSLGYDKAGRAKAVEKAVACKAITSQAAQALLPAPDVGLVSHILTGTPLMLDGPGQDPDEKRRVLGKVAELRQMLQKKKSTFEPASLTKAPE